MLEHKHAKVLPRHHFFIRLGGFTLAAAALVLGSLALGAFGYHHFEAMSWLDATLNAAMILTGMGPVQTLHTPGGKEFAIVYALFSGIIVISASAVMLTPLLHRLLHTFHLEKGRNKVD